MHNTYNNIMTFVTSLVMAIIIHKFKLFCVQFAIVFLQVYNMDLTCCYIYRERDRGIILSCKKIHVTDVQSITLIEQSVYSRMYKIS